MQAIDNIRRDLREASWLKYSDEPFAGAVHNFSKPMAARLKSREYVGPYYWSPAKPGGGRGFYQHSKYLACGDSIFDLRLEDANDHLGHSRLAHINGYYCDPFQESTIQPIIARLPRGRGFLAGWTMGRGMLGNIDLHVYDTPEDAARAAHNMAEHDAAEMHDEDARQQEEDDED